MDGSSGGHHARSSSRGRSVGVAIDRGRFHLDRGGRTLGSKLANFPPTPNVWMAFGEMAQAALRLKGKKLTRVVTARKAHMLAIYIAPSPEFVATLKYSTNLYVTLYAKG